MMRPIGRTLLACCIRDAIEVLAGTKSGRAMDNVFTAIFLIACLAMLIGLVRPSLVLPRSVPSTRRTVLKVYVVSAIIAFVGIGVTAPAKPDLKEQQPAMLSSEMTIAQYEQLCGNVPEDIYKARCSGKRVVWTLFINQVEGMRAFEARASAAPQGRPFDIELEQDFKWVDALDKYKHRKVVVTGIIRRPAGYAHDIESAEILQWPTYTPDETATVELAAKEAETRKKEEEQVLSAHKACRRVFRENATHPSTVDFPLFDRHYGATVKDGRIFVQFGATAKNSFGTELGFVVRCIVKDGEVTSFTATEG